MLLTLFNILLVVLGFTVLIFVHELGHFLAARWARIRVEAFAIGMGPVVVAFRKGIGFRRGSTEQDVLQRVDAHFQQEGVTVDKRMSVEERRDRIYAAMDTLGIGETEYSFRWLPVGGFVKMLGQEDGNPGAVSGHPHSYNRVSVGKRMIVVSAGVIMNLLFALIVFIAVFLVGVQFEAPLVGRTLPDRPAAVTMPENAAALGVNEPGLLTGDRIRSINGAPTREFNDIMIAAAMAKPGDRLVVEVDRDGFDQPLRFTLQPERDEVMGLYSIGVLPAVSTVLHRRDSGGVISSLLEQAGVAGAGVEPGMRLVSVGGREVETFQAFEAFIRASDGESISTTWSRIDRRGRLIGEPIDATIEPLPELSRLVYQDGQGRAFDHGLLGLSPLTEITAIAASTNRDVLQPGDVILRIAGVEGPRPTQLISAVRANAGQEVAVTVLRDGAPVEVRAMVSSAGQLGVQITPALGVAYTGSPINEVLSAAGDDGEMQSRPLPVAPFNLMGGSRIVEVDGRAVDDWREIRAAIRAATASTLAAGDPVALVRITVLPPRQGSEPETHQLEVPLEQVRSLHALGWSSELSEGIFRPIYTTVDAGGNPFTAAALGFERTYKFVVLTYITIDRLIRRTVGVEQLRGPVGIVHIGVQIADRGFIYLLFFVALISVNLAVINFLPFPILDGGLFLALIYEQLFKKPPPVVFMNFLTLVALALIGLIFLVTFYNDIMRLVTGA